MNQEFSGRLVIADPSLSDERGHHYALTIAITQGALQAGIKVIWLANKALHVSLQLSGVKVHPVFSTSTYDPFKKKPAVKPPASAHLISRMPEFMRPGLRKLRDWIATLNWLSDSRKERLGIQVSSPPVPQGLVEEMVEGLQVAGVTGQDQVLIHTSEGDIYRAMLAMVLAGAIDRNSPIFHLNTPYDEQIMPHNRRGLTAGRAVDFLQLLGALDNHILLYAENSLLAAHLSSEWEADVQPLEIPPPTEDLACPERDDDVLRVLYLGAAREEKGFHLLPDVVEQVLENDAVAQKVRFVIQCSPQIVGYSPPIEKAIAKLKAFPGELVSLIETQQSMEDYFSTLKTADVVLLCYKRDNYRVRGSGIAVEAVCFGKIIIATPDTFPAAVAGSAGIPAQDARAAAQAIIEIAGNPQAFIDKAQARQQDYVTRNSATRYVSKLFERAQAARHSDSTNQEFSLQSGSKSGAAGLDGAGAESIGAGTESIDVGRKLRAYLDGDLQTEQDVSLPRLIQTGRDRN